MKENKKRGIFKPLGAFFLALVMVLTHVMGVMEVQAAGAIPAPTINNVFYGDKTISGGKLHRDKVDKKTVRATVHVRLTDENGNEKANVSVTPTKGTEWTVNLPGGVEVAQGDKVTVYQELGEKNLPR